jgi:hypothetical protein
MLKAREIVLIAFFVSAIWIAVLALRSDPSAYYQICEADQRGSEHCTAHDLLYVGFWYIGYVFNAATITAIATGFIAWFTWTLRESTEKMWIETKKAADAAALSARAAVAIESPFIRVNAPDELTKVECIEDDRGGLIWDVETPTLPEFSRIYELKFRNIGRTTATPIKLELGWKVALPLPAEEPIYTWSRGCDHGTVIPGDNQPREFECYTFCIVLTAKDRELIFANAAALWVFGALTYRDFLDEAHTSRFCWRWGCPDGVGLYYFYTDEHIPSQYTSNS